MGSKEELKQCTDNYNINKGKSTCSNIMLGHTEPINTLVSVNVQYMIENEQMVVSNGGSGTHHCDYHTFISIRSNNNEM